jgi:hypothetical protein
MLRLAPSAQLAHPRAGSGVTLREHAEQLMGSVAEQILLEGVTVPNGLFLPWLMRRVGIHAHVITTRRVLRRVYAPEAIEDAEG